MVSCILLALSGATAFAWQLALWLDNGVFGLVSGFSVMTGFQSFSREHALPSHTFGCHDLQLACSLFAFPSEQVLIRILHHERIPVPFHAQHVCAITCQLRLCHHSVVAPHCSLCVSGLGTMCKAESIENMHPTIAQPECT